MFVAELEALHMSTKISAFQACNKEGLVRTLWRNHSQEPRVCIIARITYPRTRLMHENDPKSFSESLVKFEAKDHVHCVLTIHYK